MWRSFSRFWEVGFKIKIGIDVNKSFLETYAHNFPEANVLNLDLGKDNFLKEIPYSDVVIGVHLAKVFR